MSRSGNSQFSFADWELLRQGVVLESSLAAIADFFDEHEEIIEAIRGDLRCGLSGVAVVCIPQRGGKKTAEREDYEKSREFKKVQRFRAGIEGRISVLFRGRGMKRCRAEGLERFELFVGAAVLTNNLMKIADLLIKRSARKRRAA